MRLTFKRTFSKILAIILLVLLILWLFSPIIVRQIIDGQLPKAWHLNQIEVSYPSFNGIEINNIEINAKSDLIIVDRLFFPFSGPKEINVSKVEITQSEQTKVSKSKQFSIPFLAPMQTDYLIVVDSLSVNTKEFKIQGTFKFSGKASQFNGTFEYLNQLFLFEINLLGLNGEQPLLFSTKIGESQYLTFEYDWREKKYPQVIKLNGSIQKPFWLLLKKSKLIPADIELDHPQLAFDVNLQWPSWPELHSDLLKAKVTGEIQFNFNQLNFARWNLAKNEFSIKAMNSRQILVSSRHEIMLVKQLKEGQLVINNSKLKNAVLSLVEDKINLQNTGTLSADWEGGIFELDSSKLTLDLSTKKIQLFQHLKILFPKNLFLKNKLSKEKIIFNSKMNIELLNSKVKIKLSNNRMKFPEQLIFGKLKINQPDLKIAPVEIEFELDQKKNTELLDSVTIQAVLEAQLEIANDIKPPQSPWLINNECQLDFNQSVLKVSCETFPSQSQKQKVLSMFEMNLKKEWLKFSASAKKLNLKNWMLDELLNKDLKIESGEFSLKLNANSSFKKLTNLSMHNVTSTIAEKSKIVINNLSFYYEDIFFDQVQFKLVKSNSSSINFDLQAKDLTLASGLKLAKIKGEYSYQPKELMTDGASGFSLKFSIFNGDAELISEDFDLFNENYKVIASLTEIDLNEMFNWLEIDGLSGTGNLEGDFPIAIKNEGIFVYNGKFSTTESGIIRYISNSGQEKTANIALDALENFHYSELSLKIEELNFFYEKTGSFIIPIRVVGRNPKSQFDNDFAINPVLKGSIPAKAWSHLITGKVDQKK